MTASQQSAHRESGTRPARNPSQSERNTVNDRSGRTKSDDTDPLRGSLPYYNRRDEEGRIYDPPPPSHEERSNPSSRSHGSANGTNPKAEEKKAPRPTTATSKSGSEAAVSDGLGEPLSAADLKLIEGNGVKLESPLVEVRAARAYIDSAYEALKQVGISGPPSTFSTAMRWIFTGFGLFDTRSEKSKAVTSSIARLKKTLEAEVHPRLEEKTSAGSITSMSVQRCQLALRKDFANRTFEVDPKTPTPYLLKSISIPANKTHISFPSLKKQIEILAKQSGPNFRLTKISDERCVLHRRQPNGKWENVELSWRGDTKVNVVKEGEPIGHLFNGDALELAKRFFEYKKVDLKRTKATCTTWKIAAL